MAKRKTAQTRTNAKRDAHRILSMGIPIEERREIYCRAVRAMVSVMEEESGIAKMQAARELIHLFAPDVARMESQDTSTEIPTIGFINPLQIVAPSDCADDPAADAV